jgi:CRISPR-associated protein Cas1
LGQLDIFWQQNPSGNAYLTDAARNHYFAIYEQFITQPTACAEDQSETTFRQLFRRQAKRLKRAVVDYVPYRPFM